MLQMQGQGSGKQTLLLMRHAQSTQNKRKKQLLNELKTVQYTQGSTSKKSVQNQSLKNNPIYLEMSFSEQFLDAGLSKVGFEQTVEANKEINQKWGQSIGGVVVSPLKRALQTAEGALNGIENVHIWVEPLLSEAIHAACDIGSDIQNMIKKYESRYDFSALSREQWKNWSINMLQNSGIRAEIYKRSLKQNRDVSRIALQQMRAHKTLQTCEETRVRCQKLKERLKYYISKVEEGKKLLIISHYFMIRYLTCTEYHSKQDGVPANGIQLWNCQIMEVQKEKIFYKGS